jgi:hypothetical protein
MQRASGSLGLRYFNTGHCRRATTEEQMDRLRWQSVRAVAGGSRFVVQHSEWRRTHRGSAYRSIITLQPCFVACCARCLSTHAPDCHSRLSSLSQQGVHSHRTSHSQTKVYRCLVVQFKTNRTHQPEDTASPDAGKQFSLLFWDLLARDQFTAAPNYHPLPKIGFNITPVYDQFHVSLLVYLLKLS